MLIPNPMKALGINIGITNDSFANDTETEEGKVMQKE